MIDRFRKASIRLQFMVFASIPIPVIVICIIAMLPEPFIFQNEKMLMVRGAQIELIVTQLRNAGDDCAQGFALGMTREMWAELEAQ